MTVDLARRPRARYTPLAADVFMAHVQPDPDERHAGRASMELVDADPFSLMDQPAVAIAAS